MEEKEMNLYVLEGEEMSEHKLEIGSSDVVNIRKLFGPLIMTDLRISVDVKRGEWIIEREVTPKEGPSSYEVCARIDGQNSIEFHE